VARARAEGAVSGTSLSQYPKSNEWEHLLFNWFCDQGVALHEVPLQVGRLSYTHFCASSLAADGRPCFSYGRSHLREKAALKCVAEYIERTLMIQFFGRAQTATSAERAYLAEGKISFLSTGIFALPPKQLHTSNGWAVHRTAQEAQRAASFEALERHLLIKTFIHSGWRGFVRIKQFQCNDIQVTFLGSSFCAAGHRAGMVVAASPAHAGVSLGYCVMPSNQMENVEFWEPAFFEAIDKILLLKGRGVDLSCDPHSWILAGIKDYLENPFDFSALRDDGNAAENDEVSPHFNLKSFDLSRELGLPIPVYAAYAWGEDLLPLYPHGDLDPTAVDYIRAILEKNGLPPDVPAKHPIL
jgi:hypothetical protein